MKKTLRNIVLTAAALTLPGTAFASDAPRVREFDQRDTLRAEARVEQPTVSFPVAIDGPNPRTEMMEVPVSPEKKALLEEGTRGPIIPYGTRRFIYTIVDMEHMDNPRTQAQIDELMRDVTNHIENLSHGRLNIETTAAGRVSIPYRNDIECVAQDITDWEEATDAIVGQSFDLFQYDERVYFIPDRGACSFRGLGTTRGNPSLPIYTGGFANQATILENVPSTTWHEIGHNFGLGHGRTAGDSSNQYGYEYADLSTVMGAENYADFSNPKNELRGIHGVNRAFLNWITPKITLREGVYTLSASELATPEHDQVLVIPHPRDAIFPYGNRASAFYLSYRNGSDGVMADGSFAPLQDQFTQGVGIRESTITEPMTTDLYSVLQDGENFVFDDQLWIDKGHDFFSVRQVSHDDDSVTFELSFHPQQGEEWYQAGNCNDGVDNDGDGRKDVDGGDGMQPEGGPCAMPFSSIAGPPDSVKYDRMPWAEPYEVICMSEFPQVNGFGPQGPGLEHTLRYSDGAYVGHFRPNVCGELEIACGTEVEGAAVMGPLTTTVEVYCPGNGVCDEEIQKCAYPPRRPARRISGVAGKRTLPKKP